MRRTPLLPALATVLCLTALVPAAVTAAPPDEPDLAAERARRRTAVVDVFESARDAVVSISATEIVLVRSRSPFDSLFDDFFDMPRRPRRRERTSVGSGFVIHAEGYIVTNAHVVARTTEQQVTFADGRVFDAQIVAVDRHRDLAVLKIDVESELKALSLARSDDVMVGETVIAIGNPLGYQQTVTAGVVSAIDREIVISNELAFSGLIQTDASINPGNSGGPLLNALGQLIGVNTAIRGDAQNIGFAIPVDQLREVLPDLLDVERRYRIDSGLVLDRRGAPRITEVRAGGPAAAAGIRKGDVLVEIDGRPVREGVDFDIALMRRRPAEAIDLTLRRGEEDYRARLRLAARPAPDGGELARNRLGLEIYPLPPDVATELGLDRTRGLMVTRVLSGGPADVAGIEPRDVLLALGRHYVTTVDELGRLLEMIDTDAVVSARVLRVSRRGKLQLEGPIRVR